MRLKIFFLTVIVILGVASLGIGILYYKEESRSEWQKTLEKISATRGEYIAPSNETMSPKEFSRRYLSEYERRLSDGEEPIDLGGGFSQLGNDIFESGRKIGEADAKTFEVLRYGYAKDAGHAYFEESVIQTADPATFKTIATEDPYTSDQRHLWYAKDANQAYFESGPILGADVATFEYLAAGYARDKKFAYSYGKIIEGADGPSFVSIGYGFAKDKNKVYRQNYAVNIAIDPASVAASEGNILKDKNHVYLASDGNYEVPNADPETFTYIGVCECVEKYCSGYYADKNYVYRNIERLDQTQRDSFQYLGMYESGNFEAPYFEAFAKDENSVFVGCGSILKNADANSFLVLGDSFAKDKKHVYRFSTPINDADVVSFQVLRDGYAKDKMSVYMLTEKLDADVATFETMGGSYAKDKQHAYYAGIIIEGADIATFEIVHGQTSSGNDIFAAKDKNHLYEGAHIIEGKDPAGCTLETITWGGVCDSSKG